MAVQVSFQSMAGKKVYINPSLDIVHTISYSLLLLNTDLHVAELTTRMSRSQFVKNTLTAIQMQLQPKSTSQFSSSDLTYDDCSSVRAGGSDSVETVSRSKRSDSITSWNSVSREGLVTSPVPSQHNGTTPPAAAPVFDRGWESDMETLLKVIWILANITGY